MHATLVPITVLAVAKTWGGTSWDGAFVWLCVIFAAGAAIAMLSWQCFWMGIEEHLSGEYSLQLMSVRKYSSAFGTYEGNAVLCRGSWPS